MFCVMVSIDLGIVLGRSHRGLNVPRLETYAFYTMLFKRPDVYGASTALKSLQFELSLHRNKPLRH